MSDDAVADVPEGEQKAVVAPIILKKSQIKRGLSQVERIYNGEFAYVNLNMQSAGLTTLSGPFFPTYRGIKYLNISNNQLREKELDNIKQLPNLLSCTASKNQLTEIGDLSELKMLQILELDDNQLSSVGIFKDFRIPPNLRVMTLCRNLITSVEVLPLPTIRGGEKLEILDISQNHLKSVSGLHNYFPNLKVLNISSNKLASLNGIEKLTKLERLDISGNLLPNIEALRPLAELENLKTLVSLDNKAIYEAFPEGEEQLLNEVLDILPNIMVFDQRLITVLEREAAATVKQDKDAEKAARLVQEENERKAAEKERLEKEAEEKEAADAAAKEAAGAAGGGEEAPAEDE